MVDFKSIRLAVFDFDGVFTDNRVTVDEHGCESVTCCRSDGMGVHSLFQQDIPSIVITAERNPAVAERCRKLGIPCMATCDKLKTLKKVMEQLQLKPRNVCYVGNDLPDIPCMKYAGVAIATRDAYPEVKAVADIVTRRAGGYGVVREVCEMILRRRRK